MPERFFSPYTVGQSLYRIEPKKPELAKLTDTPELGGLIWLKRPYPHELGLAKAHQGLRDITRIFNEEFVANLDYFLSWMYQLKPEDFTNKNLPIIRRDPLFLKPRDKEMIRLQLGNIRRPDIFSDPEPVHLLHQFLNHTTHEMVVLKLLQSDFDLYSSAHYAGY